MGNQSQQQIRPTPNQVRAARELLGNMTQIELAQAAGISVQALIKFENGQAVARESTVDKIRQALARRGIEFTNGNRLTVSLDLSKASLPV